MGPPEWKITRMIDLPNSVRSQLPEAVIHKLSSMAPLTQEAFLSEFRKKMKSTTMASVLMLLIPCFHYFYLGKVWLNLVFWITFGGFGLWWLVDVFRLGGMVREYNKSVAISVLKEIQFLN
jgi:TM2 domain-containing membrane protein YozV